MSGRQTKRKFAISMRPSDLFPLNEVLINVDKKPFLIRGRFLTSDELDEAGGVLVARLSP